MVTFSGVCVIFGKTELLVIVAVAEYLPQHRISQHIWFLEGMKEQKTLCLYAH